MAKVISVGNITMGGTGKTPHTILLANEMSRMRKNVVVLSRGYKGKLGKSLNVISDGQIIMHTPPAASDEAFMIASQCKDIPVITGVNRVESLNYAVKNYNSQVAILDDAFQYHKIKKDIEVLLLDSKNPISTGFIFPFGYLREFPSSIKRSDIIIITRSDDKIIPESVKKYITHQDIFFSKYKFNSVVREGEVIPLTMLKNKKVAAFSAIANNKSFQKTLLNLGLDVPYFDSFSDHKLLSESKLSDIVDHGISAGAEEYITTEKDYVKLPAIYQRIFSYLKLEIELSDRDGLMNNISKRLNI